MRYAFIWISIALLVVNVYGAISNNLVENIKYPNCDVMLEQIPFRNVDSPQRLWEKDILGTWYSQSCETRPGYIHVLRTYEFLPGGQANLSLHVYGDTSCRKPTFSVFAQGHLSLSRASMITPGATEAEYAISEISIIPHTNAAILDLVEDLNSTFCSTSVLKDLKQHERKTLFYSPLSLNEVSFSDYKCVPALVKTWNELQLLRLEVEGHDYKWHENSCRRKELFLGNLHSNPRQQKEYRPTAYQLPLLHKECIKECNVCGRLSTSPSFSPPVLPFRNVIRPPKLIEGHWASTRCEVQRYGLFLTRKISFKSSRPRWSIKQRYFYDPLCKNATYTIVASGSYKKVLPLRVKSPKNLRGNAFDMIVRKMSITPEDKTFAAQLNRISGRVCGVSGQWRKGKAQDVTGTGGCAPIGLKVPSKEPEILRFETERNGQVFLYLGQTPTWPHRARGAAPRPTAWGPKLQKCSFVPEPDNHLRPMVGARVALANGSDTKSLPQEHLLIFISLAYIWDTLWK